MWHSYKVGEYIKIDEMYSLFEHSFSNNYAFSGESHNFWECIYVIDGSICVSADERVYDVGENEIVFHKPLEMHKFHTDNENGARLLIFSFSMSGSTDFYKGKVFKLNEDQQLIMQAFLEFLHSNNPPMPDSDTIFHSVYLDNFKTSAVYSQRVVSYIYQLFLSLSSDATVSVALQRGEAEIFSEAVNYMNNHIEELPSIQEIAKGCGISATGLKSVFAKYSGMGVHKYFVTLKINTATQLLKDGMSVTEISKKLGFSSQGYFSIVFKRETGFSPTEYKNKDLYQ